MLFGEIQLILMIIHNQTQVNFHFKSENVVGAFTDGFYPGQIINGEKQHITADFLHSEGFKQNYSQLSLWKKPFESSKNQHRLEISLLLLIRPILRLSEFSLRRIVNDDLLNVDFIKKFM